jgi:hypothetical protein
MGAAGRGGVGVPIDGWAMGRGAAGATGFGAAVTGVGDAVGFFVAAFFFGAARLAAGFFAAARLAGALRAAVLRAALFFRAGAFFLALVFFAPDRAALARRVVLRALAFLLVVRFFPLVLVAMFLLRFLICCRRRPPTAGACFRIILYTFKLAVSRGESIVFFIIRRPKQKMTDGSRHAVSMSP